MSRRLLAFFVSFALLTSCVCLVAQPFGPGGGTSNQFTPSPAAGSGDVVGPSGATDEAIARYDTTTGKLLQNSSVKINDSGQVTLIAGSSGTPALLFSASGTGLYYSATALGADDGLVFKGASNNFSVVDTVSDVKLNGNLDLAIGTSRTNTYTHVLYSDLGSIPIQYHFSDLVDGNFTHSTSIGVYGTDIYSFKQGFLFGGLGIGYADGTATATPALSNAIKFGAAATAAEINQTANANLVIKTNDTAAITIAGSGAATFAQTIVGSINGNAATATALAANPSDCGADTYATTIAANGDLTCGTVTNAGLAGSIALTKLATQADQTILGNTSGGAAAPIALSATQATAILNNMVGDSGAGGTKGLVPAPAAGDAAASKFLKADGTWAAVSATGDFVGPASSTDNAIVRFDGTTGKLGQNSSVTIGDTGILFGVNGTAADPGIQVATGAGLTGNLYAGAYDFGLVGAAGTEYLLFDGTNAVFGVHVLPSSSGGRNLGSSSFPWGQVWANTHYGRYHYSGGSGYGLVLDDQGTANYAKFTVHDGTVAQALFFHGDAARQHHIYVEADATANANAATSLVINAANKTAGTGNGGTLTLAGGTSSGGTAGSIVAKTAGTTRLYLDTSGGVGINTTTIAGTGSFPGLSSNMRPLEIRGNGTSSDSIPLIVMAGYGASGVGAEYGKIAFTSYHAGWTDANRVQAFMHVRERAATDKPEIDFSVAADYNDSSPDNILLLTQQGGYPQWDCGTSIGSYCGLSRGGTRVFVWNSNGVAMDISGSAASNAITWFGDSDTGINRPGADQFAIATGGTNRLTIDSSGNSTFTGSIRAPDGAVGTPSITFSSDTDTGWYWTSSGVMKAAINGAQLLQISSGGLLISTSAFFGFGTGAASIGYSGTDDLDLYGDNVNTATVSGTNFTVKKMLTTSCQTVSLTADDQTVTPTNSCITISSDDATATNRTFKLAQNTTAGTVLTLIWGGTNAGELLDDSAQGTAGNHRMSADWTPTQYDTVTFMSDGTDWHETARSTN